MAQQKVIEVAGLKEFRDGLRLFGPAYVKELRVELKAAGEVVRLAAEQAAPVGTRPKPPGVKHLRDTIKTRVSADRVTIFSSSPYANVIHWGGHVPSQQSASQRPKRQFYARKFIVKAVDAHSDEFQRNLLTAVETVAKKHGFN